MEKEIDRIEEEVGYVTINFKNGKKQEIPSKTIYTYYTDGTNDCKVEIADPLKLFSKSKEVE